MAVLNWTVTALVALALVPGCVERHRRHHHRDATHVAERISSKLDLNEEQQAKLLKLANDVDAARLRLQDKRKESRAQLEELFEAQELDQATLLAIVKDMLAIFDEEAPVVIASTADLYGTLDNEQRAKLRSWFTEARGRRHWH